MPRRPLLVLASVAAAIFFIVVLFPATPAWKGLGVPQWRGSQAVTQTTSAEAEAADRDALKELKLFGLFEFRRRCFKVRPAKGVQRTSLAEVTTSLFELPASQGLTPDDTLPPCQETMNLDVPYFDPRARVDTSELLFGMATLLSRIDASLPALSRWLSNTGSPLLVLLVDQPDLVTKRDDIEKVRSKAANLGIEILFEPYKGHPKDTEGLKNFALAEAFHKNRRPSTRWFGVIDDDTFFLSLPPVLKALKPYDPAKEWYIGALTEGLFRIAQEGFKAWGGAGFFVSPSLMEKLAANSERCQALDQGFGDLLWRDCISEITSPTVKLTQMSGLHQIDLWGDISGWYESGWNPLLTVHHWKSWHFHPIPLAHIVSEVAGPDTFLQRYLFEDKIVMTNGYSIVSYTNGLPDLNRTELTFVEEVNVKKKPGRLMFEHSLGATRPALQLGKDKISWTFAHAGRGGDGTVRQFYVKRAAQGVPGSVDSVIEVDWRQG